MIKINLLSPSDRSSAKWERINNLVVSNFLILIVAQFILALIFLVAIKYLDLENNGLNKQLENMRVQLEVKEVEKIKSNMAEHDKQFKAILGLQEDRFVFTEVLESFSAIIPAGVKINSIDIKSKIKETSRKIKRSSAETKNANNIGEFDFNITGIVKNRESLLEFENNLRNSEVFVDLIIDLSNYDNKNNDFKYSMTIEAG